MKPKRTKKHQQLHGGIRLKPDSSWGKETLKFKVDKKNNRFDKERVRCTGVKCKKKPSNERNKVLKGQECEPCYKAYFEELRYQPSDTPYFDNEFLTRYTLG